MVVTWWMVVFLPSGTSTHMKIMKGSCCTQPNMNLCMAFQCVHESKYMHRVRAN